MLDPIIASTRRRIELLRPHSAELEAAASRAAPVRGFGDRIRAGDRMAVISEIKRRSPSKGPLAGSLDPVEQATRYVAGGAAAVSVLTEPDHFDGSNDDLVSVRSTVGCPVLRKDFVLDPIQVWEARAIGADAVLLIVALLDDASLRGLIDSASALGMDAVVEVHTVEEASRALNAGASIIGVNNRNLATFDVTLDTAEAIAPAIGPAEVKIAESGIFGRDDAARMADAGYDAILVGEALVTHADPGALVSELSVGRRSS